MKFSTLNPILDGHSTASKPGAPAWMISFDCPVCRGRTEIIVADREPAHPIYRCTPGPLAMQDAIQSGRDISEQWREQWDKLTIMPSVNLSPHAKAAQCPAHFTVSDGNVA